MLPVHAISARSSTWRGGALSSFSLAGSISLSLKDSEERRRSSCVWEAQSYSNFGMSIVG